MKELINQIQNLFPEVSTSHVELPEGHSVNDMYLNYGVDTLLEYINENKSQNNTDTDSRNNSLDVVHETLIKYKGNEALFEIRGSLPLDMGKMDVTLAVINPETNKKIRLKIDLYEQIKITKECRRLSEEYDFNFNSLETDFYRLIDKLEEYRDSKIDEKSNRKNDETKARELTPSKEKEAISMLKQPDLFSKIDNMLGQSGIVGEKSVRTTLFVIASSYKMPHQLHAIVQGESGSGKTHLINAIADCLPNEDVKSYTRISEKALQNMSENELMDKCIIFQDLDGLGLDAKFALRELQSFGKFDSATPSKDLYGNHRTSSKVVYAKMSSLSATTKGEICYDNMTRSIILGVDESDSQTQDIIEYQNKKTAGIIDETEEEKVKLQLRNIIRVLKPYKVVNKYAHQIKLPVEAKMLRRLNTHFQFFVEQITLLNQYQRKTDKNGCLLVTKEDIKLAIELFFTPIFLKVDDLDSSTRQFFEQIKEYVGKENRNNTEFTQLELRKALNKSKSRVSECLLNLKQLEYIKVSSGSKNKGYNYKIAIWDELDKEKARIKENLMNQLDNINNN